MCLQAIMNKSTISDHGQPIVQVQVYKTCSEK